MLLLNPTRPRTAFAGTLLNHRRPLIIGLHALLVAGALWLAFLLRFDGEPSHDMWILFLKTLPVLVVIRCVLFARFGLFQGLWRYVSVKDLVTIVEAATAGTILFVAVTLAGWGYGFPRSIFVLDWILCVVLLSGVRICTRLLRERDRELPADLDISASPRRAVLVGAGDAGERLLREIQRNRTLGWKIVAIADDHPAKRGLRLHGVRVQGSVDDIPELVRKLGAEEILLAIPSANRDQRRRILDACRAAAVPVKSVPSIGQIFSGRPLSQLESVGPEDLLGRRPARVGTDRLRCEVEDRRVLVTGAGGSIGSELARQLALLAPQELVLLERAESSLYFVDLELRRRHPDLRITSVVGDITDRHKVSECFKRHMPDIVYHAAAYKHVPLMEQHPIDAIVNNVFGTCTLAETARACGVRRFVLISTDKAVNPVSTMGRTKRVAEAVLRAMDPTPTTFVSVRFGNVLGSAGSVLPVFQWQIYNGGPVTVTDPDASRYFMLIPEAVELVLQAGAMARGGEVYFLDMGEPLRVKDLAEDLIRLAGYAPGRDVAVETIGLRAGERLREELVANAETLVLSEHDKIFVTQNPPMQAAMFREELATLRSMVEQRDQEAALRQLAHMASAY